MKIRRPGVALFFLVFPVTLLGWRVWGAIQVNRAFVTLNHGPLLFAGDETDPLWGIVEGQLVVAQDHLGSADSIRRMLAVVRRAQGQVTPPGLTVMDLWRWGEQKGKAGDWPAAAYLYEWAIDQQPDLGDSWFYLGHVYTEQNRVAEALIAYHHAAASPIWHTFGPSDAYLALGNLAPDDEARGYYEQALQVDQFGSASASAAAHYQLGELLLLYEEDPVAAIPHYRATLALNPADHWAWLRLGYALYWGTDDLNAAAVAIQQAITLWPAEKYQQWPYFYLGEIYENAGLRSEAMAAYEQALQFDPNHESARQRLTHLRSP